MAAPWLPRVLRLGHITLEEGLKPHFDAVKKMWIKPRISKRVAARIRKEAIITGNYKEGGTVSLSPSLFSSSLSLLCGWTTVLFLYNNNNTFDGHLRHLGPCL